MNRSPASNSGSLSPGSVFFGFSVLVLGMLSCALIESSFLLMSPVLGAGLSGRAALLVGLTLGLWVGVSIGDRFRLKSHPARQAIAIFLILGFTAEVYPWWAAAVGGVLKAWGGLAGHGNILSFLKLVVIAAPALGPAGFLVGFLWAGLVSPVRSDRPSRTGLYLAGAGLALIWLASPIYHKWGIVTPLRFTGALFLLAAGVSYLVNLILEPEEEGGEKQAELGEGAGGGSRIGSRWVSLLAGLFFLGLTGAALNLGRSVVAETPYALAGLLSAVILAFALGSGWYRLAGRLGKGADSGSSGRPGVLMFVDIFLLVLGVVALVTWAVWYPWFKGWFFPSLARPDWTPGVLVAGFLAFGWPLVVLGRWFGSLREGASESTVGTASGFLAGVALAGLLAGLAGGLGGWGVTAVVAFGIIGLVVVALFRIAPTVRAIAISAAVAVLSLAAANLPGSPFLFGEDMPSTCLPGLGRVVRERDVSGVKSVVHAGYRVASNEKTYLIRDRLSVHLPILLGDRKVSSALVIGMATPWILESLGCYGIERIAVSEPGGASSDSLRAFLAGDGGGSTVGFKRVRFPSSGYFQFSIDRYDLIIAAVAWPPALLGEDGFSREFLTALRDHLETDGVVALAIPLDELDLPPFSSICRTFQAVFPTASIWWSNSEPNPFPIFLGWNSATSLTIDYTRLKDRMSREGVSRELADLNVHSVDDLLDYYIGDETTLEELGGGSPLVERYRSPLLFPDRPRVVTSGRMRTAFLGRGLSRWRRSVLRQLRNLGPDRETQAKVRETIERRVESSRWLYMCHIHHWEDSPALSRNNLDLALNIFSGNRAAEAVRSSRNRAEKWAGERAERSPRNPDSRFEYGRILFDIGRFDRAVEELRLAVDLDPTRLETYTLLGQTYQALGKYTEANRTFEKALVIDPRDYRIYNHMGLTYYLYSRELDRAIEVFQKGIRLNPDFAPFYNYLGLCYASTKIYWREAIREFEKAIEKNPRFSEAHFNLANVYSERWYIQKAVESYHRAIELNPFNPIYHSALAWAYISRSEFDRAIRSFREAYAIEPNESRLTDIESAVGLSEVYVKNIEAGRIRIRQILVRTEEEALLAGKRLKKGDEFQVVARDMSIAPDATKGGDLGFLTTGLVHRNIEDVVLTLRSGEISGVIRTPLGYHLIQRVN